MVETMEKTYDPTAVEKHWYQQWEAAGAFQPDLTKENSFAIVIPPPNVTGALHIGHALNNTLQDILTRYHRMAGAATLWLPGTDHAGIATQNVVEKSLLAQGTNRHQLGREKFIAKVWDWQKQYGNRICNQLRYLGFSLDWSRQRFTLDQGLSKAVREVFVSLYEEGYIYQGQYIINWCPRCHTALSEIEVEHQTNQGQLWQIKYSDQITVATTRPETMLGDTAVAVHPDDPRYQNLIGTTLTLPLVNRSIPIIADEFVDQEFGTGAVKVTPAHDPNDFAIGKRHQLAEIQIMDQNATMNENVPEKYRNLDRYACREQILADLQQLGLLVHQADHENAVGQCYRCKTVVEPTLSTQWFVRMQELVKRPLDAVRRKEVEIIPPRWEKLFFDWMENIRDWCISRQIWWGHRLPVWYCDICLDSQPLPNATNPSTKGIIVAREDPTHCPHCNNKHLRQDPDVLDTWFSSALWPFSTMGWPDKTSDLQKFYPTTILVTGYDILTFWVSRMLTLGYKFMGKKPFAKVYVHGLVRDETGKKMSKSLGNVIDPLTTVEQYSADALRFALASLITAGGQDIKLSVDKIQSGRNFLNKVWNVTRYTCQKELQPKANLSAATGHSLADKWILSRCHHVVLTTTRYLETYAFGEAANLLYEFTWGEFCDWYVEMNKADGSSAVLKFVLKTILKLLHPFVPFITEELWHKLGETSFIMLADWPVSNQQMIDKTLENKMQLALDVIKAIRNIRATMNVPPAKKAQAIISAPTRHLFEALQATEPYIKILGRLQAITLVPDRILVPPQSSTAVVKDIQISVPLAGLIDLTKEQTRLQKELDQIRQELARSQAKLNNASFIAKAPPAVIQQEKEKEQLLLGRQTIVLKQLQSLS
jgi:valyl-tRNA synthetase